MTPTIYPISASNVSLDNFVRGSIDVLGYSPLRGVDAMKRNLSLHARFVAALAGFHKRLDAEHPLAAIRDARSLLEHLHFGFLVHCDTELILGIREKTSLHVTSSEDSSDGDTRIVVMSGTLSNYRSSAIEVCVPTSPFELTYLFDQLIFFFEKIGLGDIWFGYQKITQRDGTFLLEYKG